MGVEIHPTAIVHSGAEIGAGTVIGPFSVVGARVVIGKDCQIGSHVVVEGNTTIGDENQIFQFASVGARPQDLKYHGEDSLLVIGKRNIIREYVTLQPGTEGGGMRTEVGDENLFMATCHVGHDCHIGNQNVFANCAALAGHVTVGNQVTVGGLGGIHQFVRLGDLSFLGAGAMVSLDIPPFCMAQGDRAALTGLNHVGMGRRGYTEKDITGMKRLFREVLLGPGLFKERLRTASSRSDNSKAQRLFLDFLLSSQRGVAPMRRDAEASLSHGT